MSRAVNKTDVCVVWGPALANRENEERGGGILQVTVFVPSKRTVTEHLAIQSFLRAIDGLQKLRTQRR